MTSKSAPPWDFAPIYDLLDSFSTAPSLYDKAADHGATPVPRISDPSHVSSESSEPVSLGDFSRLFDFLGRPFDKSRPRHGSTESSSTSRSHHSTPPSSIPDEAIHFDEFVDRVKEVRWTDQVDGTVLAEKFESEPESSQVRNRQRTRRRSSLNASADEFTHSSPAKKPIALISSGTSPRPRSEGSLWVPPPIPKIQVDPLIIQPIYYLTVEEKTKRLMRKLKERYQVESDSLGSNDQDGGIHVFVDCSNIIIGFYNTLKIKRGYNIRAYTRQAPISWHSLALILERGACLRLI